MIITGAILNGALMVGADTSSAADSYFNLVTLLLPGNGTNGAQNNTFLDSSGNNLTVTRNGNTTQGTFSPFSQTGWSVYFDGTDDAMTWSGTTLAGDFTAECWVYKTATDASGYTNLFSGGGNQQFVFDYQATGAVGLIIGGSVIIGSSGSAVTANAWHHLAWVREGSTCRVYVNGVQQGTGTSSSSTSISIVGKFAGGGYEMNGYVSNVRILAGTCLYPGGTTFTPPTTPLTAIANTQVLICQNNRFIDNSSNAYALTIGGTPLIQPFAPFNPTAAYSASTVGGSGYFDGTGDYLSVADNTLLDSFTDFTIETWVYFKSFSGTTVLLDKGWSGSAYGAFLFYQSGGTVSFYGSSNGSNWDIASGSSILTSGKVGEWYHLAVTRSGTAIKTFANGALTTSGTTTSAAMVNSSAALGIGASSAGTYAFNGYLSDVRIIKGTALYTSAFTPPTAPLTAVTNTSILLNYTNAGISDATAKDVMETVGNAQISTAQSKFGGSSMAFDGTGDWLFTNGQLQNYTFGSGNFTVETWLYTTTVSPATIKSVFDTRPASTQGVYPLLYLNTDGTLRYWVSSADRITSSAILVNTWYHVALSKSGSSTKLFINGTQAGSTYTDTNTYLASNFIVGGSYGATSSIAFSWAGYMQDFRITKGYARYTSDFTPPTTAFSTQ